MSTIAENLGGTAHLSPVLRKARRCGLHTPGDLLRLAVRRGCRHYAPADYDEAAVIEPGQERLSDLEVAMALMTAAQNYDPQLLRCAAQLLGSPAIRAGALVRMAVMERCVPIVRHIAESAARYDDVRREFWTEVLADLPAGRPVRAGVLPHPTRFVSQTGYTNPRRKTDRRTVWLRPTGGALR